MEGKGLMRNNWWGGAVQNS